jgi:hypothetical protein
VTILTEDLTVAVCLDTILRLIESNYQVYPIKGNHEQQALKAEKEYDKKSFYYFMSRINKSDDLLTAKNKKVEKEIQKVFMENFLCTMNLMISSLSMPGLIFPKRKPFKDEASILNIQKF